MRISSSQELTSTLHFHCGVHLAFVGETTTFTCETVGSNSIGWSSAEYIGKNGVRLEFASSERNGTIRSSVDSMAIAQLISFSSINGIDKLVSQLQLTAQSKYQVSSVSCHNIGIGTKKTTYFRVAGEYIKHVTHVIYTMCSTLGVIVCIRNS